MRINVFHAQNQKYIFCYTYLKVFVIHLHPYLLFRRALGVGRWALGLIPDSIPDIPCDLSIYLYNIYYKTNMNYLYIE